MERSKGRHVAIGVTALALIVVGVATWQAWRLWPHIVFRWRFEALGPNAEGYQEYRHRQTGVVFVRLPGGTFSMGSPEQEPGRHIDEGPAHAVTLSPFLIGKYEVTQAQWRQVMGDYPSFFDGTHDASGTPLDPSDNRDRLPVEQVSWDDIQEFERKTGLMLPSEAQWEFACRGGTETAFSFGSAEICGDAECTPCPERDAYMWYCANSGNRTHEVGTKKANPFGLHDMHGNVWEWIEDKYSADFYSTPPATTQDTLCTSGSDRGFRGGSWDEDAWSCRSAFRYWIDPRACGSGMGFRIAAPSP